MGLLHEIDKTEVITVIALFDYVQSYMTGVQRREFTTAINLCSINFQVTPPWEEPIYVCITTCTNLCCEDTFSVY